MKDLIYGLLQANMKRFTRAGLYDFVTEELQVDGTSTILVVGGKGPILEFLKKNYPSQLFTTLDIQAEHKPDYHLDLADEDLELKIKEKFDSIVLLEVLEHIPKYVFALENCNKLLKSNGKIIGSTPWIIPPHDLPHDYHRFTNYEIERSLIGSGFTKIKVESRGKFRDAVLVLGLRGLKSGNLEGKVIHLIFSLLSLAAPRAKRYSPPRDTCIGYNWSAVKP